MTLFHRQIDRYDPIQIRESLEQGLLSLGGVEALLKGRNKILLKPNFVAVRSKEANVCTRPEVILAVADVLLDRGVKVALGESPGFGSAEKAVEMLGLQEGLEKRQIPYFTFSKVRRFRTDNPKFPWLSIAAELEEYDGLINLAKVKTHCQTQFSGAVKNLYGCVPGKRKAARHMKAGNDELAFMRMLVDNYHQAAAFLHLGDGIEALHRHGPTKGDSLPLGSLFLGDDGIELDWAICRKIGLDPMQTLQFQVLGAQKDVVPLGDRLETEPEFEHALKIPIFFNPARVLRSVLRQWWIQARFKR